jgi:DNA repair protein RecO (recombination protein O)
MHHIYTTKAIIIKSVPIGEANKYYFLLTEDLGFVRASAQGVRLDKSKLKGHLQDFCFVKISLVKGKDIWRITSVETIERGNFLNDINKLIAIKNVFNLLLRLLHGEEKNEPLFHSIESFYNFLLKNKLSQDNVKNLETITVLRVLYNLGYFKKTFDLSDFVKDNELSIDILNSFDNKKKLAILDINNALNETHL